MKPNAFIDPKAFGHFVIMPPTFPTGLVHSAPNDFPFYCKRFFNPPRTVFSYADIHFTGFAVPDTG